MFPKGLAKEDAFMDLMLKGLRAIVTGGTKGIGRAIAETLAAEGADIAICARNPAEVAEAVAALSAKGVKASGKALDISDGPALRAWVVEAAADLGGLDIVVANVSALAIPGNEENWKKGFDTDMMGTVRLVDAAMPFLEASKSPAIVTISSVSGREIDFASGPYGAFKAAIIHYTQGLAFSLPAEGGVWNRIKGGNPALWHRAGPQSNRPDGHTAGNGQCGRVPRQPRRELHYGDQSGRRRRFDARRAVLSAMTGVGRGLQSGRQQDTEEGSLSHGEG